MQKNKNEIISILLTPQKFLVERPAMSSFQDGEIQEAIYAAFNLINGECANLPMLVWRYNYPAYDDPPTPVDANNDLYRNEFEIDQFLQALITQTQYTLNIGNDYSQGSSTFSTGGISASIQRPENRDVLAPGVLLFLQNARLYQMQSFMNVQKEPECTGSVLDKFLTTEKGDMRYVEKYQDNAVEGSIAVINSNKMVTFADPNTVTFKGMDADRIKDTDGDYKPIHDIENLAFYGTSGEQAMKRIEVMDYVGAQKIYDDNFTYAKGDVVYTYDENKNILNAWLSNEHNNIGHDPILDNTNFFWWKPIAGADVQAKQIWDPIDQVYRQINEFSVEYFGGLTKEQIYFAINASGTVFDPKIIYRKGFVVIFVDSSNALEWYESLQDNNMGNNPETSTGWWKKLPTPAIDVNEIINQIKPYLDAEISKKVADEINKYKTKTISDYSNSVYAFNTSGDFDTFIANNPQLSADMFEDVPNDFYTKDETDLKFQDTENEIQGVRNELNTTNRRFDNYYLKSETYNRTEIDTTLTNYYTKLAAENLFVLKTQIGPQLKKISRSNVNAAIEYEYSAGGNRYQIYRVDTSGVNVDNVISLFFYEYNSGTDANQIRYSWKINLQKQLIIVAEKLNDDAKFNLNCGIIIWCTA